MLYPFKSTGYEDRCQSGREKCKLGSGGCYGLNKNSSSDRSELCSMANAIYGGAFFAIPA